jgi:REP element-mobilizing transposase RayT
MPRELPQRATIRWTGHDYAQCGAYYVTIVTDDRRTLFGRIADGAMEPSPIGDLARQCWDALPQHIPHVGVGEFVVMPNHVHGIVIIRERLVDVRVNAMDGAADGVWDGAMGVGARHDAPGTTNTPDTNTNATDTTNAPDDPGTGMPGGVPDTADEHFQHTRARHDAPLRDPRKPPGIPRGALGQIVASYKSAVTRMAYRHGLLPHGTPIWQRNYWDRVIRDDAEHDRIARYIADNPANWGKDRFKP